MTEDATSHFNRIIGQLERTAAKEGGAPYHRGARLRLTLWLPPEIITWLQATALKKRCSRAAVVRDAVCLQAKTQNRMVTKVFDR